MEGFKIYLSKINSVLRRLRCIGKCSLENGGSVDRPKRGVAVTQKRLEKSIKIKLAKSIRNTH